MLTSDMKEQYAKLPAPVREWIEQTKDAGKESGDRRWWVPYNFSSGPGDVLWEHEGGFGRIRRVAVSVAQLQRCRSAVGVMRIMLSALANEIEVEANSAAREADRTQAKARALQREARGAKRCATARSEFVRAMVPHFVF